MTAVEDRGRRRRYNTPLPPTHVAGPIVWYGRDADGYETSGVLSDSDVAGFVMSQLRGGWLTLRVYVGGVALGGIKGPPRHLWLTPEAVEGK